MKIFKIPVTWEMCGFVKIEALSELSDVAAKVAIDTSMFAIDTDYSDF